MEIEIRRSASNSILVREYWIKKINDGEALRLFMLMWTCNIEFESLESISDYTGYSMSQVKNLLIYLESLGVIQLFDVSNNFTYLMSDLADDRRVL